MKIIMQEYLPVLRPVKAVQWDGEVETYNFLLSFTKYGIYLDESQRLCLDTTGAEDPIRLEDWIVKDDGEYRIMTDDKFKRAYKPKER